MSPIALTITSMIDCYLVSAQRAKTARYGDRRKIQLSPVRAKDISVSDRQNSGRRTRHVPPRP